MGMRQRLGLAAALLGDPQVLVLDEPSNGLDPEGIRWLRGFLRHLSHEGKTILVSSHLLQEVEQTVDEVVIIANGRLVRAGAMADLHGTPGAGHPHVRPRAPRRRAARRRRHQHPRRRRHARRRHHRPAPGRRRRPARRPADLRPGAQAGRPRGPVLRAHRGHQPQRDARGRAPRGGCRDRPGRSEPVIPAIRSEFRKFFTTRMWWGMAIAIFVAGGAFAALFTFVVNQGTTGGPGGQADHRRRHPDRQHRLHVRHQRRLPAAADHRRDVDRLGVPPQDDQRHLPGHPEAHPRDAGQGRLAHRHRRRLRPDQPGRVGRGRRGGPDPDRPPALPLLGGRPHRSRSACWCSGSGR